MLKTDPAAAPKLQKIKIFGDVAAVIFAPQPPPEKREKARKFQRFLGENSVLNTDFKQILN